MFCETVEGSVWVLAIYQGARAEFEKSLFKFTNFVYAEFMEQLFPKPVDLDALLSINDAIQRTVQINLGKEEGCKRRH